MDLNWLEDFLALAEHRNFSRAAETRHVTQPAFSRRIQALEAWIGTPLVRRSPQSVTLNAAGEYLQHRAADITRDLHQMRRGALRVAGRERAALTIAATHALSFTFFPGWVRANAPMEALGTLNLVSDTMAACERILLAGEADFLLCHHHGRVPARFEADRFRSVVIGTGSPGCRNHWQRMTLRRAGWLAQRVEGSQFLSRYACSVRTTGSLPWQKRFGRLSCVSPRLRECPL